MCDLKFKLLSLCNSFLVTFIIIVYLHSSSDVWCISRSTRISWYGLVHCDSIEQFWLIYFNLKLCGIWIAVWMEMSSKACCSWFICESSNWSLWGGYSQCCGHSSMQRLKFYSSIYIALILMVVFSFKSKSSSGNYWSLYEKKLL